MPHHIVSEGQAGYVVVAQGLNRARSDAQYHRRTVTVFRGRAPSLREHEYDELERAVAVFDTPEAAVQVFVADASGKFERDPISLREITASSVQKVVARTDHSLQDLKLVGDSQSSPNTWESARRDGCVGFFVSRSAEFNAIFREDERLYEDDIHEQYEVEDQIRADFANALRAFFTDHTVMPPAATDLIIEDLA